MSNTWGNGPVTSAGDDQWNSGTDTTGNWNQGGATTEFDAQPSRGFNDTGAGGATGSGGSGGCFNCGNEGHMKFDRPNPRVERPFDGQCRVCNETGHRASDCPSKPPKACKQCGQENPDHEVQDCKAKKVIDDSAVPSVSEREAWLMIEGASNDRDIDDFKDAVKVLAKAQAYETSYLKIEKELRKRDMNFYLIALKKEIPLGYTNVDLNLETGKKHTLGVFKSSACPRPVLMDSWPLDGAENLARLEDTGIPLESGVMICNNCKQAGHGSKSCDQESTKPDPVQTICSNCGAQGHRLRDCDQERPEKRGPRTCKFCDSPDHIAKDCEEKDKNTECRNCFQLGHRSNDCTNEKVLKCDNCDTVGHLRRECDKPRDWSRVTCRHCGEKGHGSENRCNPEKKAAFAAKKTEEENEKNGGGDFSNGAAGGNGFGGGSSDWQASSSAADNFDSSGSAGWEVKQEPIAVAGNGW